MNGQSSTKILYQLRTGFVFLIVLVVGLGILATTKIRGISHSVHEVKENYIVIAEIGSLIDENVYESTQALQRYFDTGVGLEEAKQAAGVIDRILIGDQLQTTLGRLHEPELGTSMKMLQQATRSYVENITILEQEENVSHTRLDRLMFLESKVVTLAGIVKNQAWERASAKVQAADQLSQDAVLIILISALVVAVAGLAVEGASFVLVRDFTSQQEALLEHYQKEAELERNLREAEVRILHSQINPHFLFNTLNVISAIAFVEGTKRITKIVKALADLLRYGLKFAGKLVPLSEEIDVVEKYLLIQKERFGKRLRYSIQIEPGFTDLELPAMTLQPLVENALIHGIEPQGKGGIVRVVAYGQAGDVVIEVTDSGKGAEPGALEDILEGKKETNHLGVELVYRRLQHFFGNRIQMRVFTNPGRGFRVQIRIMPINSRQEQLQDPFMVLPISEV